jgi:hypothetical protein
MTGSGFRRIRSRPSSSVILLVLEAIAAMGADLRVGREILAAIWTGKGELSAAFWANLIVLV